MNSDNNSENKQNEALSTVVDSSNQFSKKDVEDGKLMAILSYIGILALIPYFAEKDNKFVVYHAKQGLNLLIIELIVSVGLSILASLFFWGLYLIIKLANFAFGIFVLVLSIMGIVDVCNGRAKELPVINKFKIIK